MKTVLFFSLVLISNLAAARNQIIRTKVAAISCTTDKWCHIEVVNPATGMTCTGASPKHWSIDATTSEGKNLLSMAQTALVADRWVSLYGNNTCPAHQHPTTLHMQ